MGMRINAAGIVTADLARSIDFYRRLGCEFDEENEIHVEAQLGSFKLMLDAEAFLRENGFLTRDLGSRHGLALAVECDAPEEVDTLFTELSALTEGYRQPFDAPWGQRYSTVLDPDGTPVDIWAWLPGRAPASN